MKKQPFFALTLLAAVVGNNVYAQSQGSWMVRGGATNITPSVSIDYLTAPSLPHTQAAVDDSTRLSAGITYMVNDHLSVDLPLALPFKHDISGGGAIAGVGKLGDVKALPVTLLGQWRFMEPNAKFRPYLGAGLTYAHFYGARGTATLSALTGGRPGNPTTLSIESKWAPTFQLGATLALNEHWFADATYAYTLLKTRTSLSTGQTLDIKLNPSAICLAVGYKF
ncbi:MAG: OmpW family protein [Polaromonas sp.]|nr:OmpW family protein [Polaromonas sp.]